MTLLAQLLAEEVLTVVYNFPDGVLKPVVVPWEGGVVAKGPPDGVIQQLGVVICAAGDGGSDGLRKRLSASLSVETGLGFRSVLGASDDTVKPVGNANISTTIVGNVNDELFGASRLKVLYTFEEGLLEYSGCEQVGVTKAAKSQNTSLSPFHVVELAD